jgi:predicted RNase H-like HicB family nuclease
VFWSDEDNGFIAIATDLPGCSAFGETQPEALAELQDAIAAWIEAAQAAGNPIPEPSDPAGEAEYSGKVLLRIPRDLHARLARLAKTQTVSLNQYLVYLLTSASTYHSIGVATYGAWQERQHPRAVTGFVTTQVALPPIVAATPGSGSLTWSGGCSVTTNDLVLLSDRKLEPVWTGGMMRQRERHG